jgi:hypothetical protein
MACGFVAGNTVAALEAGEETIVRSAISRNCVLAGSAVGILVCMSVLDSWRIPGELRDVTDPLFRITREVVWGCEYSYPTPLSVVQLTTNLTPSRHLPPRPLFRQGPQRPQPPPPRHPISHSNHAVQSPFSPFPTKPLSLLLPPLSNHLHPPSRTYQHPSPNHKISTLPSLFPNLHFLLAPTPPLSPPRYPHPQTPLAKAKRDVRLARTARREYQAE